jgi:hypothetical protein
MSWNLPNLHEAAQNASAFSARYPQYRDTLDEGRVLPWVRTRLTTAIRCEDPFPHVWIENILPPEVYAMLDAAWPAVEFFALDKGGNRADLIPAVVDGASVDPRREGYSRLPSSVQDVWAFFLHRVNRGVVGPWLSQVFKHEIDDRIAMLTRYNQEKPHLRPPFDPRMNVGRLMMRKAGHRLRPHVDAVAYLATALYYFPDPGDSEDLGTTLHRADRPLDATEIFDRASTTYFDDAEIVSKLVTVVPFRANTMLAFANTARSAHGNRISNTATWRRVFQSHLSLKSETSAL